ncbi:MAG: RIP metalloprotease RseP [Pseudomonadota bacterium]
MNFIQTVLAFLLALGPLIIFHELGHYAVARLCGVKVLRFSLGMGKIVWSRKFGADQTEWAISALPLGGYVKMLDARDPDAPAMTPAEQAREFTRQSVWRRLAIIAAGPLANFVLAIVVFSGLYMHGVEELDTRVRFMPETTAAWQAGLRGGDRVIAVNGTPVAVWSDLRWEFIQAVVDKGELRLDVERAAGGRVSLAVPASALAGLDVEGDLLRVLGMSPYLPAATIEQVLPGGPGARAGLRAGDVVTEIDGQPVADSGVLLATVRAAPGRTLVFGGQHDGAPFSLEVTPERDPASKLGRILVRQTGPQMVVNASGPISAVGKAVRKTWETSFMTVKMVGKMMTGEVSWKNVTGPITIADYAGQSARAGAIEFLGFIAFISISLGVMNLLPIPVLDGGLLLYYSLEVLTGRPLPERIGEIAQRAGLGLLVMLMALAVFNDVARLL